MDISLIVPGINFGIGEMPPWADKDQKPQDPKQLIADYEEAGVQRILVGLDDMTDDASFKRIEDAAKGLGLAT